MSLTAFNVQLRILSLESVRVSTRLSASLIGVSGNFIFYSPSCFLILLYISPPPIHAARVANPHLNTHLLGYPPPLVPLLRHVPRSSRPRSPSPYPATHPLLSHVPAYFVVKCLELHLTPQVTWNFIYSIKSWGQHLLAFLLILQSP